MIKEIKMHFSIGSDIVDSIENNIEVFDEISIQQMITQYCKQGKEVLCQYDKDDFVFIPGNPYIGKCFYKFRLNVPLEVIQIDTFSDGEFSDDINMMPTKGLVVDQIKGGNKLIEIYDETFPDMLWKNNDHYLMYGCSLPEFKIEYLKKIELWFVDYNTEFKMIRDLSFVLL